MNKIGPFQLYTKTPNDINYGSIYTMKVELPIIYSKKRIVRVYLPEDFEENKKYPVLFMADGQNIVDKYTSAYGAWSIDVHQHHLLKKGYPSFIVVGIDCPRNPKHRALEYSFPFMHICPNDNDEDLYAPELKFESHMLYEYIARELLPLIRQYFPISDDRKDIGAGGSSMGGIFALSLITSYPEIFGFSLVFSPGLFLYPAKKVKEFLDESIPKFDNHKMYFYCGNVGFESKFLKRTVDTFNYLKSHGMNHNNIHLLVDPNADHNEASWSKHFEQGIKFWFKR